MKAQPSTLTTRLARSPEDIRAAQRVRYDVFVKELGSDGPEVDHENRLEKDALQSPEQFGIETEACLNTVSRPFP